jgi:hypothetical protein
VGDQLVRSAKVDLRRQIPAQFAAKRTLNSDELKGELPDAGWNVAAAPFAGDDEQSPLDGWESECHFPSIGEEEANISTACSDLHASI